MTSFVNSRRVRGSRTGRPIMALLDLLGRRMSLRILWELSRADEPLTFRPLTFREGPQEAPVLTSYEQVIGLFEHYLLLDGSTVEGFEPGIVWVDLQKVQEQLIWHTLNQPQQEALAQGGTLAVAKRGAAVSS